jgi:aspartyl-tRNA(Asn)/glutamyl-tRNA(Gln) amidotransferase subunit B
VALLEIVTEPDMETGEEAELFIRQLRRIVRYLGVCDGNMEEGSLRADANVSINLPGRGLGRKVEIKNLNSSRFVKLGLNYEILRQGNLLDQGKEVIQETRLWNENRDETMPMRTKENAQDYRYFPEPDLPVFSPDTAFLSSVEEGLVELPIPRARRMAAGYGLTEEQADLICEEKAQADYFEASVREAAARGLEQGDAANRIARFLLTDIKHILRRDGISPAEFASFPLTPPRLASLISLIARGVLSGRNGKQTLEAALAEDKDPEAIVRERGWEQFSDPARIAEAVKALSESEAQSLAEARKAVAEGNARRAGALASYLVGKALSATGGRADPRLVKTQVERLMQET